MRVPFALALLAVAFVGAAAGWGLSRVAGSSPAAPRVEHRAERDVASSQPARLPRGWSYIAVAGGPEVKVYRRPALTSIDAARRSPIAPHTPLTFLVRRLTRGWASVYLPWRPNGSTGWVRASEVRLLTTAYSLRVSLTARRLQLLDAGRVTRTFPVGVGRSVTPTPPGTYYLTALLKQPDPKGLYGPYAFGTSAHSDVLTHFGVGGNGQIGIHGTNEPARIGTYVSHGCIRLLNRDISWLAHSLPLGTPVRIEGS